MHIAVYGDSGVPLLMFPSQDGMCDNPEGFGMIDTIADWIDAGITQVFVPDTVDPESWSPSDRDFSSRIWRQEQYFHFIVEELVPYIHERNYSTRLPVVTGFSLGGTHTAITFLRRPDLFAGMLAISGVYNSDYFFGSWMNPVLYDNTPTSFLRNMPLTHPYISLYNSRQIVFCVGQGAWEDDGVRTLHELDDIMDSKGIEHWSDYWGYDVNHDWVWWKKMIRYHLPGLLKDHRMS